jgi:hypothetical protein
MSDMRIRLSLALGEAGADTGCPDELSRRPRALAERVAGVATVNLADASDAQRHRLIGGFVHAIARSLRP